MASLSDLQTALQDLNVVLTTTLSQPSKRTTKASADTIWDTCPSGSIPVKNTADALEKDLNRNFTTTGMLCADTTVKKSKHDAVKSTLSDIAKVCALLAHHASNIANSGITCDAANQFKPAASVAAVCGTLIHEDGNTRCQLNTISKKCEEKVVGDLNALTSALAGI